MNIFRKLFSKTAVRPSVTARQSDLEGYVQRLIVLSKSTATHDDAVGYLGAGRKRAVRIGQDIHSRWGHDAMVYVCERIAVELGPVHYRELEMAWHGIGQWLR